MFFLKDLPSRQMIEGYSSTIRPGGEKEIAEALVMMRNASVLVRQIDQYFSRAKLSQLKFLIMIVIDREPDRMWLHQSEIADRLDVSKPVLARTVQALLEAGLLHLSRDERDKRWKRLSLSPDGARLLSELLPGYFDLITDFMRSRNTG